MKLVRILMLISLSIICIIPSYGHFERSDCHNEILFKTITGQVVDEVGVPVPGATVILKGTTIGTVTDFDGNYSLEVPDEDSVLVFSYTGFRTEEVTVGDETTVNVTMVPEQTQLDEVVVTGFKTENRSTYSGSASIVSAEEVANVPAQTLDRALQGRSSGVLINGNSGIPGASISVTVRGSGTITGNSQPLYIVDGVQINAGDNSNLLQTSNGLGGVNPNDIETITILKDAVSTSLYGAQGGNGVVVITTKSGNKGKSKITLNTSFGTTEVIRKLDVLSRQEYLDISFEALANAGFSEGSPQFDGFVSTINEDGIDYVWNDFIFKKGNIKTYELAVQGGGEKGSHYISVAHSDTEGHVIGTNFKRYTLKGNINHKVNDKLSVNLRTNLALIESKVPPGGGAFANPIFSAYVVPPTQNPFNPDGTFRLAEDGFFAPNSPYNALSVVANDFDTGQTFSGQASLDIIYNILPNLVSTTRFAGDLQDIRESAYDSPLNGDGEDFDGRRFESDTRIYSYQLEQLLNYSYDFKEHSFNALLGLQYKQENFNFFDVQAVGFPNEFVTNVGSGSAFNGLPDGDSNEVKLFGLFFNGTYKYDNKYILDFAFRRDGSSRFGSSTQYGLFPSMAIAWRISQEDFMSNLSFVNDLKLRFSRGSAGSQQGIGPFAAQAAFGSFGSFNNQPAVAAQRLANPTLTWEESTTTNIGLDYGLFKNRISGSVDVYRKITDSGLLDASLPNTTGFASIASNLGEIENRGVDVEVTTNNVSTKNFKWRTDFNISFQDSEVLSTGERDTLFLNRRDGTFIVGEEPNGYFLPRFAGVNTADGRPLWFDENGDVTYNSNFQENVGNSNINFYGGLNNSFSYKGLSLDFFFQYQSGGFRQLDFLAFTANTGNVGQQHLGFTRNRWQSPGDLTDVPIAVINNNYPNGGNSILNRSTWFLDRQDYIRLKRVSLSYNLPDKWSSLLGLSNAKVYGEGYNLWTWTDYRGFDPESAGSDFGDYPQAKSIIFGVNLEF
ncbi:SusC/RagA family TonB-linked outer membrane protein [Maribacter sp. 2210JD10-5]|uniref:SusC/RagA family TonB-linked outer membrane protein n=1 Tax=Maribacter sp. 2210JD10-5 TaxID=3386272 RepID=UPI0039BD3036